MRLAQQPLPFLLCAALRRQLDDHGAKAHEPAALPTCFIPNGELPPRVFFWQRLAAG